MINPEVIQCEFCRQLLIENKHKSGSDFECPCKRTILFFDEAGWIGSFQEIDGYSFNISDGIIEIWTSDYQEYVSRQAISNSKILFTLKEMILAIKA